MLYQTTTLYTYDAANRRVQEIQDASVDGNTGLDITTIYVYDILGRLIKLIDSKANKTVWQYDAAGRQVSKVYANGDTILMEYDLKGRLTKRTDPVANYFYDARNMRVLKDIDTNADGILDSHTSFYYDDMIVVEERDETNSGALLKSYVHGKQYMHELIMQSASPTALGQFYLHSHLWNVHALIDTTGAGVERYRYEAYGKRSVYDPTFTPRAVSLYAQKFGRTGHYLDPETAMYYYGYRYYAPDLGQWISRDPIEEGDGWNLYAFVRGRPIIGIDLLGENWWEDPEHEDPYDEIEPETPTITIPIWPGFEPGISWPPNRGCNWYWYNATSPERMTRNPREEEVDCTVSPCNPFLRRPGSQRLRCWDECRMPQIGAFPIPGRLSWRRTCEPLTGCR